MIYDTSPDAPYCEIPAAVHYPTPPLTAYPLFVNISILCLTIVHLLYSGEEERKTYSMKCNNLAYQIKGQYAITAQKIRMIRSKEALKIRNI